MQSSCKRGQGWLQNHQPMYLKSFHHLVLFTVSFQPMYLQSFDHLILFTVSIQPMYLQSFDHLVLLTVSFQQVRIEYLRERSLPLKTHPHPRHEVQLSTSQLLERGPACEKLKQHHAERVHIALLGGPLRITCLRSSVHSHQKRPLRHMCTPSRTAHLSPKLCKPHQVHHNLNTNLTLQLRKKSK
jgi:hypothetical protein